jgi:hypothetical protein
MHSDHNHDQQLLDEAIATMRDVRARAPHDFLVALGVALGVLLAVIVLLSVLLQDQFAQGIVLNLGAEIFGAWLTVVLIDGLWRRIQTGSLTEYEIMAQKLATRKATPLTDEEREAWRLVIHMYRHVEAELRTRNPFRFIRAIFVAWNERRLLEAQGNRALVNFERQVKAQIAEDQHSFPASGIEREELVALRNEVVELRKIMEQYVSLQTGSR